MTARVIAFETMVVLPDGTRLATDIVLADGAGPRPALMVRTPYSRAAARQGLDVVGLARQGWAVVMQDVRGRFDSEGAFEPFLQEQDDGADVVTWAATQPWCDGRVAGFGSSYLGFAQLTSARARPAALLAMAPVVAPGDIRDGWMYEGGAFQLGLVAAWAAQLAASDPALTTEDAAQLAELSADWRRSYLLPLAGHPLRRLFPAFERWLDPADADGYWSQLDLATDHASMALPAFAVAGWYDLFCESSLRHHTAAVEHGRNNDAPATRRLVIGPWTHMGVFAPATTDHVFGRSADGVARGIPEQMLAWLGRALDGEPVEAGVDAYVIGTGEWRALSMWPPPSQPLHLYLGSERGANSSRGDGTLVDAPAPHRGTDRFRYRPHDPVPTQGGRLQQHTHPLAGPVDQRNVEQRDDVLVYSSRPLERDITVMGLVTASVFFSTDARSADVTVKLVDVHPDGYAFNVVDSLRRCDFVPGRVQQVDVDVGSTAICLRRGHQVRVEISSSNFPRFDRNPSTGQPPRHALMLHASEQAVHHGGRVASRLSLPVVA